MTREEILEKYGDTILKFKSYYKFSFCYQGVTPDVFDISAGLGGNSDDIYRHSLEAEMALKDLDPSWIEIKNGDEVIAKWQGDYW